MRRVVILTLLAILSVALLGTAAYTLLQSPVIATPQSLKRDVALQRDVPPALFITVPETGIIGLHQSQLHANNLRLPKLSAETVNLTRDGRQIPFHVIEDNAGATLYFFAEAETQAMTAPVVYRLEPGVGLAMAARDAVPVNTAVSPTTTGQMEYRWEENSQFWPQTPGNDVWLGPLILAPGSWELAVPNLAPEPGSAQLTLQLISSTQSALSPDHHVEVLVNGRLFHDYYWDGISQESITLKLLPGTLLPEGNSITLNLPGNTGAVGEAVYLDWLTLQYESQLNGSDGPLRFSSNAELLQVANTDNHSLIFDVSRSERPVFILGSTSETDIIFSGSDGQSDYLIVRPHDAIRPQIRAAVVWPQPLRTPTRGADYLAIVSDAPSFMAATQQLLDYRSQNGMAVTAVSLSQVYDEFGHGRITPVAIRDFLAYAVANWQPAPRFVLLVGDDNYESARSVSGFQWLPSPIYRTQFNGYVASDTWFTTIGSNPEIPTLAIGRLPARNAQQLYALVNKTIAYETTPPNAWQQRALLVTGEAMQFDMVSDSMAGQLTANGFEVAELRVSSDDSVHYNIISAFNRGASLINYVGQGSEKNWGDDAVFHVNDAAMLTNGTHLPIFVTFTNLNGVFNMPAANSLGESLLWAENGGVVAAIAPSARTDAQYQLPLYQMFYDAFLGESTTLGEALLRAKQAGMENPALRDGVHTVNLLGDPALRLKRP